MPASRYITSASRYHPRYQSRSSMYIRGLIPWNFAELAEAVPIDNYNVLLIWNTSLSLFACVDALFQVNKFSVMPRLYPGFEQVLNRG